jgi:hypothetical protein
MQCVAVAALRIELAKIHGKSARAEHHGHLLAGSRVRHIEEIIHRVGTEGVAALRAQVLHQPLVPVFRFALARAPQRVVHARDRHQRGQYQQPDQQLWMHERGPILPARS